MGADKIGDKFSKPAYVVPIISLINRRKLGEGGKHMLKDNIGDADRVVRAVLGVLLITAFFIYPVMMYRWWTMIVALFLLFTAVMSSCPVYSVLGWRTNKDVDEA